MDKNYNPVINNELSNICKACDGLTTQQASFQESVDVLIDSVVSDRCDPLVNECPPTTEGPQAIIQYSTCNFYSQPVRLAGWAMLISVGGLIRTTHPLIRYANCLLMTPLLHHMNNATNCRYGMRVSPDTIRS